MRNLKFGVIFVVFFLLVGCSAIQKLDQSGEYKKASSYDKPLNLPKDMNAAAIEDYYPVPKADNNSSADASILPPKAI